MQNEMIRAIITMLCFITTMGSARNICRNEILDINSFNSIQIRAPMEPFRNQYLANVSCQLTILNPNRTDIIINIYEFAIEFSPGCLYRDFLSITTSNYGINNTVYYCGLIDSKSILKKSQTLTIGFQSDNIIQWKGFKIRIDRVKDLSLQNDWCRKNVFFTTDRIIMENVKSESNKNIAHCFGNIWGDKNTGILIQLVKVNISRNFDSCEEGFIKLTYMDNCINTEIEKVFCGILLSEFSIVAHSDLVQFEIKAPITSQLMIKYRQLRQKENRCQFTSLIKFIKLTSLSEQIEFNLTNDSEYVIDQSNRSVTFAMKIETLPGWKINVNFKNIELSKYEIRVAEYFEYDLNIFTIKNMTLYNDSFISSTSYQLTLVIRMTVSNSSSCVGFITVSDVTRRSNIINIRMSFNNVKQLMNKRMLQIVNDVKLGNDNLPVSIFKIKRLALFNYGEQDYSCNQSGIYIYNKTDEIFGPYCHDLDFIPLKYSNLRLIYYYFRRNDNYIDFIDNNDTILELSLEFYPCNFTTLKKSYSDFKFYHCLTLFEPVSMINTNAFNYSFLLWSNEEVALFKLYSRIDDQLINDTNTLGDETTLTVTKSKTCFFLMKINQMKFEEHPTWIKISINTSCQYIPSGWSVHLELKSRQRVECNMFIQSKGFDTNVTAAEGILTGDVRVFSLYTQQSVIFPVCYWYFKAKDGPKIAENEYRMLSLKMEFFNLDCDKYELTILEKINSAIHKVVLSKNTTADNVILSRGTNDIYITLTFKTTSGMTKMSHVIERDYFLISFRFVTHKTKIIIPNCNGDWWRIGDNCIKYDNGSNISWRDAQSICSKQDSTLIKIDDYMKRDGLKELAMTKWFSDIYSSDSVVIFIGLKNEINGDFYRLKWPMYDPMIYDEWFGRSYPQPYSYVSPSLQGIVSKTLPQPSVENNNQQCTAMMMQHPIYWLNWVKIPCDSKIKSSTFICEKKAVSNRKLKIRNYYTNQIENINDPNEPRCEELWIFQHNKCLMIMFFSTVDIDNLEAICKLKNSKVSIMSLDEALKTKTLFKKLWPHVIGSLYYKDGNEINRILESSPDKHVICERPTIAWQTITEKYSVSDHLFWCAGQDQYWISIDDKCDSRRDCLLSNDDEKECDAYKLKEFPLQCDKDSRKSISWNRFCDFIPDCPNEADEMFCFHPPCKDNEEWRCANKQCINIQKRCDLVVDCIDGSDERECNVCNGFNCSSSVCLPQRYVNDDIVDCPGVLMEDEDVKISISMQSVEKESCSDRPGDIKSLCSARSNKCMERNNTCIYHRDNLGIRDVCSLMDHLQNCDNFTCPGLFQCIKMNYCIELHYVCDGVKDCPNGEDEEEDACSTLRCPLHFRCIAADKKHLICLERKFLCNGIKDCLHGIDEKYCDVGVCPSHCRCSGHKIHCNGTFKQIIRDIIWSMRFISVENTSDIELYGEMFSKFPYLGYLSLRHNNITSLSPQLFSGLYNLLLLDLSFNKINILPSKVFNDLQRLKQIDLSKNPIQTLEPFSLFGLVSLTSINLTSMNFNEIPNNLFSGMSSKLTSIDMSRNDIKIINKLAFEGISNLSLLDITVTKIDIVIIGDPLAHVTVKRVETNIYKICCSLAKFETCSADTDIASNCDNLLANSSIQVIVWILGITGLLGNIVVILWRLISLKNSKDISTEEILVLNLAISDLLLSIYLVIIVVADHHYRNKYVENSILWKAGYTCTIAGYLATVSNQASATFLGLITLDRVICIVLTSFREYVRIIKYLTIPVWVIWTFSVASFEYYRFNQIESVQSNGLCLTYFSLDFESSSKNAFSSALIIYILIFLVLIVLGYIVIFINSCRTRQSAGRALMLNDYKSARKMLILVLVFFLCWFPMIVLSFVSKSAKYRLTNDQLTWLTVVLMPLNSCINPYMYTFSNVNLCFTKRQNALKKQNVYTLSALIKK